MANVYTILLGYVSTSASGSYLLGTVPAGYVWDVRQITAYARIAPSYPCQGVIFRDDHTIQICGFMAPDVHGGKVYQWSGRQLLQTGEKLYMDSFDANWIGRATGYQLTLP
jgi:hypothetical protein